MDQKSFLFRGYKAVAPTEQMYDAIILATKRLLLLSNIECDVAVKVLFQRSNGQ